LLRHRAFRYLTDKVLGGAGAGPGPAPSGYSASVMKRNYYLALVALTCVCQPRLVFSQTPEERAGARAAADQGYDAFERGEWEAALDLFGRAESLVHSPVQMLYVARSNARLNRLIEAQEAYLRIVREPLPADAAMAVKKAHQDGARELAALEPQLPSVSIEVEGVSGTEPLEVSQDGHVLPPALVGVAHPVNPGEHTWQARSGSRQSTPETRSVAAGSQLSLKLTLPEAEIELVVPKAAPAPAPDAAAPPQAKPGSSGPSPWVYVGFGVAATGLGVGTGFLLHKSHLEDQIRSTCSDAGCFATPENVERKSDADRAGLISAIAYTTGGVALAGAIALWLLEPDAAAQPQVGAVAPRLQLWLSGNGASVSGSF
jgi:hypothetical protein